MTTDQSIDCEICREVETQYCAGMDGAYSANLKGCRDFLSGDPVAYGDTREQAITALHELLGYSSHDRT